MTSPQPFRIHVPDEVLRDLRRRLAGARLLPDSPRRSLSGMTAGYLERLVASWEEFDWRARESWLNAHPQFLAEIDDATIHFVHLRSARADAPVLLVMHGWPHTFALQLDFADLLPDFHVIVPSLPGFAFSSPYRTGRFTERRVAETMHSLVTDILGYDRYFTYGEDVSANINDLLAATHPEAVRGVIVTHAHFPRERSARNSPHPTRSRSSSGSTRGRGRTARTGTFKARVPTHWPQPSTIRRRVCSPG
ncbi:epoxide hydrolase family protein [Microbacterium sp. NIBRBAC000506063]|uniref:epoxide hydrolase family protein n=1 Tax=Microbacterium sp. NIBRBAC000506063 TaxID=2734618 RepID=UPI001CB6E86D|nr:epoxide hydrolase [Microbacterium sp. NIBRBAC000506063]